MIDDSTRTKRILLVDAGNTRMKWRIYGVDNSNGHCLNTRLVDGVPEVWSEWDAPDAVRVSRVTGTKGRSSGDDFDRWVRSKWAVVPTYASGQDEYPGVVNRYRNREQLGVDRWLAAIAAWAIEPITTVSVDCGTAVTIDLIQHTESQDGADCGIFHGGIILPGLDLLQSAVTSRVPHLEYRTCGFKGFFADNTADAVGMGIRDAIIAPLDRFIENSCKFTGDVPRLRVCGGDARWLQANREGDMILHDNLVLDGLQYLSEYDV